MPSRLSSCCTYLPQYMSGSGPIVRPPAAAVAAAVATRVESFVVSFVASFVGCSLAHNTLKLWLSTNFSRPSTSITGVMKVMTFLRMFWMKGVSSTTRR